MPAVSPSDIVIRSSNDEANIDAANSFATYAEIESGVKFRMDDGLWDALTEDRQVKAMSSAYNDIIRLSWKRRHFSQSRDVEGVDLFGANNLPPIENPAFVKDVKRAQIAQVMYICGGTQIRDMTRQGIRVHKNLSGAEMEFGGYRGPVCAESLEILADWIELAPRRKRMA